MMWYFEEPVLGTWRPRTSADEPTATRLGGGKRTFRAAKKIAPEHEGFALNHLSLIYGSTDDLVGVQNVAAEPERIPAVVPTPLGFAELQAIRDSLAAWQKILRDGGTVEPSIMGLGDMIRVLDGFAPPVAPDPDQPQPIASLT
jgi:hypothetical protein